MVPLRVYSNTLPQAISQNRRNQGTNLNKELNSQKRVLIKVAVDDINYEYDQPAQWSNGQKLGLELSFVSICIQF